MAPMRLDGRTAGLGIAGAAALVPLTLAAVGVRFYDLAIARRERGFLANDPDLAELPTLDADWITTQPLETLEITSHDGLRLRGYYLPAPQPTANLVVLAHGYNGRAQKDMGGFARLYHEHFGYHVFMPDARGHGASEGTYIGFGWPERVDYGGWIAELLRRFGQDTRIALHGVSMGGATVLMTSGEVLPPQVRAVIADCAYTTVKAELTYQLRRVYGLPAFPIVPVTNLICKLRAGYFFGEASALAQVRRSRRPTLFIHGEADEFVPTAMVYPLHEACAAEKALFLVPGAGHGLAYTADPDGYTAQIAAFLERRMA
jgi:fermentation-respiration switch protein FrsA (DUF1100 family)